MTKRMSRFVVGIASAALVAGSTLLGTSSGQAADGTLVLDPTSGTGDAIFAFRTSGGCANPNADYFTVVMRGAGLRNEVFLNGVTAVSAISATPTQTTPMSGASAKLFDKVKEENGGRLPNGNYTISLICRAKMASAPLRTFTGSVAITNTGSRISWRSSATPAPERMVNTTKPRVTGNAVVGATLRANAGQWQVKPDRVTYNWRIGKKSIGKRATIKVPRNAKGKTIRLTVTATKKGYEPGSVTVNVRVR
jgi:hypothetical protein